MLTRPGLIPGFTDVLIPYPFITNYAVTANYTMNPTTFLEGTYGFIRNELTGGNENGILINDSSNRLNEPGRLPADLPGCRASCPKDSYALRGDAGRQAAVLGRHEAQSASRCSTGAAASAQLAAEPALSRLAEHQPHAGRRRSALTKVAGRHTMKAGFYNNHSFKAQNVGAGGIANLSFQGYVELRQRHEQRARHRLRLLERRDWACSAQYLQASKFVEGSMLYNNTEFYIQDNWKVNSRLTLDYGMRFTRQQPQYDQFQQMSNFFPEQVDSFGRAAPVCPGLQQRRGHLHRQHAERDGSAERADPHRAWRAEHSGGHRHADPGHGQPAERHPCRRATASPSTATPGRSSSSDRASAWRTTSRGDQSLVFRGGGGLFYDRPDGNTVFSIPGNPPIATSTDLRYGSCRTLGSGLSARAGAGNGRSSSTTRRSRRRSSGRPASRRRCRGRRWLTSPTSATTATTASAGSRAARTVNLNAIDFGAAYLPQNQDLTRGPTHRSRRRTRCSTNLLRPYRGLSNINAEHDRVRGHVSLHPDELQPALPERVPFGVNYVLSLSFTGNTGLQKRLQHAADGSVSVRADQADYEKLNEDAEPPAAPRQGQLGVGSAAISTPNAAPRRRARRVVNDWQLSGLFTGGSGNRYDLGYSYQSGIGAT